MFALSVCEHLFEHALVIFVGSSGGDMRESRPMSCFSAIANRSHIALAETVRACSSASACAVTSREDLAGAE